MKSNKNKENKETQNRKKGEALFLTLVLTVTLYSTAVLIACKPDDDGNPDSNDNNPLSALVGEWLSKVDPSVVVFEIRSTGILIYNNTTIFDISVSGNTVTLKLSGNTVGLFDYSISNGEMTMTNTVGIGQTFAFASPLVKKGSAAEPPPKPPKSDFQYTENGNSITITGYDIYSGSVTIPAQINGKPVNSIGDSAFYERNLDSVTIPSSVTSIGEMAFRKNKLTGITIPNSVTSIGKQAFCENQLTSVTIGNGVTSIGEWAFGDNYYLVSVTFATPSKVITVGDYAFANDPLASVAIPNSVTSIGDGAFINNNLTSVTIPNNIAYIGGGAFSNNNIGDGGKLADVAFAAPSKVASIGGYAFGNNKLTSVTIPNSVTSIGDSAFAANRLTSVTIPNNITSIGERVFASNQLTSVTIPNSVISIGDSAFEGNPLTSVTFTPPSKVTTIGDNAFYGNRLTGVTVPNSVTSIGGYAFAIATSGSYLLSVTIGANVSLSIGSFNATYFADAYATAGKAAGTYTRPDTSSTTWTKQ